MKSDDIVRVRVNKEIKENASEVLSDMGLTISDAVRLLLVKIANEKKLPFEIYSQKQKND